VFTLSGSHCTSNVVFGHEKDPLLAARKYLCSVTKNSKKSLARAPTSFFSALTFCGGKTKKSSLTFFFQLVKVKMTTMFEMKMFDIIKFEMRKFKMKKFDTINFKMKKFEVWKLEITKFEIKKLLWMTKIEWGAFYLLIADFFAT